MSTSTTPSDPNSITGKLCNWVNNVKTEDIPDEVLTRAKYLILDGVACGLVAAHLPWSETAAKGIFDMEPEGQCTILGWGGKKLSPVAATVLNSTFIQGFELDDYHSKAPLHSNSLLLPALFASVEHGASSQQPKIVNGAEFLKAYIIGCEIGPRVGLALHGAELLSRGWHSGALQGPAATAGAVGALLDLTPAELESAFGIACTQAGGLMSAQFGSMAKRMQHGFASRNGLYGALMARAGYTGIEQVFETPYGGFLSCFSEGSNFEPKALPTELIDGLGDRWEIDGIRVKLHAAMAALHSAIDCAEHLQQKHPERFAAEKLGEIESIKLEQSKAAFEHGGWIAPVDKAMTSTSAQMSVQYAAAAQLLDGQVLMAQYDSEKLNRPAVREIMAKTTPSHQPDFDTTKSMGFRTRMTVHFQDGTELVEDVNAPKGIEPPVSNEDIVDKWRRLVHDVLDEERMQAIEKCVLSMDQLGDVRELISLLEATVRCPIKV